VRPPAIGLAMTCVAILSACGATPVPAPRTSPADAACVPVDGVLAPGSTLEGGAGAYRLEMFSEDGQRWTAGELTLVVQPDSLRVVNGATSPLFGSTTAVPNGVGAPTVGGLDSVDPAAPGVLVLERDTDEGRSVALSLGSAVNRRGVVLFDAASVVLDVLRLDAGGFAGAWRGEVGARSSRGYFCATRQEG